MAEIGWLLLKDSSPCSKQRRSLTGTSVLLKLPKERLAEGSAFRLSKLLCCRSVQFSSVQSSPVQFSSVQFSSVQFRSVQRHQYFWFCFPIYFGSENVRVGWLVYYL